MYGSPAEMPYRENQPVPPGYHPEDRVRKGPLITGVALIGSFYLLGLAIAAGDDFENQKGWMVVPVLGPWLTYLQREDCDDIPQAFSSVNDPCYDSGTDTLLLLDGLIQGTGALLVGVGVAIPRTVLVRDEATRVSITPSRIGVTGHGLAITGRF